jgi:DNA-binding HxlR family transcriptional regulator
MLQTPEKTHLPQVASSSKRIKADSVKSSAMTLIVNELLVQPHTCASLVQTLRKYSSSHISSCLKKLKNAGLIGAKWDSRKVGLVYYNIKLKNADSKEVARPSNRYN